MNITLAARTTFIIVRKHIPTSWPIESSIQQESSIRCHQNHKMYKFVKEKKKRKEKHSAAEFANLLGQSALISFLESDSIS